MGSMQQPLGRLRDTMVAVVDPRPADYAALLDVAARRKMRVEFLLRGRDALQLARTVGADLWVIHVALPDMSGFDLCTMLRTHAHRPVIYMVTDEYRVEDERAAWVHGASLFGCKPVPESWFEPSRQPPHRTEPTGETRAGSVGG